MDNILVTGGAGYIGSHVCKSLANAGYNPIVFDNLSSGYRENVKWGFLEMGNLNDKDRIKVAMKKYEPKAVIHMASSRYGEDSSIEPARFYKNNVAGTINLLEAINEAGIKHIIFASSGRVYKSDENKPFKEGTYKDAVNPYIASKLMAERIISDFARAYDINYIIARYFNVCGADSELEIGENHDPETHLIPLALDAVHRNKEFFVYGNDYDTKDGTCVRDFIHVSDVADAHIQFLEYLFAGKKPISLNLGSGKGHSVKEVLEAVEKVTGKKLKLVYKEKREGDLPFIISNNDRAEELFDTSLKYKNIEDMIETAWKWYKKVEQQKEAA